MHVFVNTSTAWSARRHPKLSRQSIAAKFHDRSLLWFAYFLWTCLIQLLSMIIFPAFMTICRSRLCSAPSTIIPLWSLAVILQPPTMILISDALSLLLWTYAFARILSIFISPQLERTWCQAFQDAIRKYENSLALRFNHCGLLLLSTRPRSRLLLLQVVQVRYTQNGDTIQSFAFHGADL